MVLNNMKKIVNGIEIELTQEEIAQRQLDEQQAEQDRLAFEAEKQAKIVAKASALAKLTALGLTEEEVKSIL
jgi:ribosomal protein L15